MVLRHHIMMPRIPLRSIQVTLADEGGAPAARPVRRDGATVHETERLPDAAWNVGKQLPAHGAVRQGNRPNKEIGA